MNTAMITRQVERRRWHRGEPQYLPPAQHPNMDAAHYAVTVARRAELLKPWPRCAVPDCQQRYRLHAHHPSYAPDMWLEVVWLCRGHHTQLHMEHRQMSSDFTYPRHRGRK